MPRKQFYASNPLPAMEVSTVSFYSSQRQEHRQDQKLASKLVKFNQNMASHQEQQQQQITIQQLGNNGELSVKQFRNTLSDETAKLEELIKHWSSVLETISETTNETSEEEVEQGPIRSAIGQAKLLISQRFKQFSNLIDNCENNTGPMPTRLDDLLGFWEMIYFQVEDVKVKFSALDK